VRDLHTNADWDIFGRAILSVPQGGSVGSDDKLFAFWKPEVVNGGMGRYNICRIEKGMKVEDFQDRQVTKMVFDPGGQGVVLTCPL